MIGTGSGKLEYKPWWRLPVSVISGLMGIAVTDGGTVFLSSSKEHPLFSLKEEEMLGVIETLTKVCGETAGHRDGVQS